MPNQDGTGPTGKGPRTGRDKGSCKEEEEEDQEEDQEEINIVIEASKDLLKIWVQNQEDYEFKKNPALSSRIRKRIFESFKERLVVGDMKFGDSWKGKDNLQEAEEELLDAMAYLLFEKHKLPDSRKEDPYSHGDTVEDKIENLVLEIFKSLHSLGRLKTLLELK